MAVTLLQQASPVSAIHPGGATNHVELTSNGGTIAVSINGTQVASVQNSAYTSGRAAISTGVFAAALPTAVDARFSSFTIT